MGFLSSAKALLLSAPFAIPLASGLAAMPSQRNETVQRGNPLSDEFGRYVKGLMDEWKVPGLSLAVIDGDQVYAEGYGFSVLPDTPVKPETLFLGGSTTKAQVGAALAHLISTGDYDTAFSRGWETPISSIIEEDFVLKDEWATAHITLEDAISHRSGMPGHDFAWTGTSDPSDSNNTRKTNNTSKTNRATVRSLRHLPLTAEPRVVFQYCNLMYIALSHVIETVTGSWLGDVLRNVIWQPLGMNSTFLSYSEARRSGHQIATGYFWDDESQEYVAVETDPVQYSSGAGAIITNAIDYSKWVKCLLHETAPFSAATHQDIKTPRTLEITGGASRSWHVGDYGLGWRIATLHGKAVYKHNGGTQNFGTNVFWMPEIKFGVVGFANAVDNGNFIKDIITQKLAEDRLGISPSERLDDGQKERKRQLEQDKQNFNNATNILYPSYATNGASLAVDYDLFVGTYSSPGYGNYTFAVEDALPLPGANSTNQTLQKQLVATRADLIIPMRMILRHVAGDYWVAYLIPILGSAAKRSFYAAKFVVGGDGKPTALEITWQGAVERLSEVTTRFDRLG
ncbi:hypothetical protein NHJ13051_004338 [Beauveria bassiana]